MEKTENKKRRRIIGTVVSNKMQKTIVAEVTRQLWHKKYNKQYKLRTKFKIHDEKQAAKAGDTIMFEEGRPLSKEKRWHLIKIIK